MSSRTVAIVIAVLFAVLCAIWLLSARDDDPALESASPTAAQLEAAGPGADAPPVSQTTRTLLRSERSEDGARAAAVADVLSGQRLLASAPTRVAEAVREYTATESAEARVMDVQHELEALRRRVARGTGDVHYVQAPLAVRVLSFSPERAQVSVWWVGVLWRRGGAEPQAGWATTTVDLVWEADAWKVWSETTVSGPTPFPNADPPVTAQELELALSGFDPWQGQR